jgi:DNA-binding beta-propeller fold protein YncE
VHILPAVRRLEEKYGNELVVIGVHAGKFIAERDTNNIRTATHRLEIEHPVINDRQFRTWRAYNVQAWPTVVLISPDGQYIGQHAGEITFEDFDPVLGAIVEAYSHEGLLDSTPIHFARDAGPATDSPLLFPGKVVADAMGGRLFIADTGHNRVLVARIGHGGESAEVVQVIGGGEVGMEDGSFAQASLNKPQGMTLQGDTLYIADTENHSIRAANLRDGTITTIAGTGQQGHSRAGGIGTSAELNSPWDLLIREGWLYIAMAGTHQLWRMNLATGEVRPFVGSGRENIDDGPNPRATLAQPSGLATDGKRLFFADSESSAVRVSDFTPEGYTQTLIGEGLFEFGDRDGKALQARLQHCLGVAYHNGKLYIADTYNNKIKTLDLSTNEVYTSLGSVDPGELYEPGGISVWSGDCDARLYVADTNSHSLLQSVIEEAGNLLPPVRLHLAFTPDAARMHGDFDYVG